MTYVGFQPLHLTMFSQFLQDALELIPKEFHESARITIQLSQHQKPAELVIWYSRPETAEETQKRHYDHDRILKP